MAVVRIVVDIRAKSELDALEIEKIQNDLHKYAYAVITEQKLDGDEAVESTAHIHASSTRYSCEACSELSNDEIN